MAKKKISKEEQEKGTRELLDFLIGNKLKASEKFSALIQEVRDKQKASYEYCNEHVPLYMFDINLDLLKAVDKLVGFAIDFFISNVDPQMYEAMVRHDDLIGTKDGSEYKKDCAKE